MKYYDSYGVKNVSAMNESSLSINITNLRVGTGYQISVVAYTSAGLGAPGSIFVSTLPDGE